MSPPVYGLIARINITSVWRPVMFYRFWPASRSIQKGTLNSVTSLTCVSGITAIVFLLLFFLMNRVMDAVAKAAVHEIKFFKFRIV